MRGRAIPGAPPRAGLPDCCGSAAELQTLLEGSILLMEEGDAEVVPVGTAEHPAVKRAPGGLLMRVAKEVDGATARYVPLMTLASTSSSVWPGVLASKTGDGALAATCHADGRQVAIRLAGRVRGHSAFQLVETLSFQVLMETTDVVELERALEAGPRITPWSAFHAPGPLGDSELGHGEEPASGATVSIPAMVELAAVRSLPQLAVADVAAEVPLSLATTAARVPDPERCARVISWVWAAEEPDRLARLCQEQWLARLSEVVALALGQATSLRGKLPKEWTPPWSPVEADRCADGGRRAPARPAPGSGVHPVPPRDPPGAKWGSFLRAARLPKQEEPTLGCTGRAGIDPPGHPPRHSSCG
ncbi:MAG: hypothetical protein SGPRY_008469 [Prymnesium sp.]